MTSAVPVTVDFDAAHGRALQRWVIILNYEVAEHCVRLCRALAASARLGLLVVDNASSAQDFARLLEGCRRVGSEAGKRVAVVDRAGALGELREFVCSGGELVVLRNEANAGYGGGNNAGLRTLHAILGVHGAYLIVNPDLVIAPETALALLEDAADICGPAVYEHYMQAVNTHGHAIDFSTGFVDERLRAPGRVGMLHGCCIKLSGRALARFGFLPEDNFMYGEEIRYFERVNRAGGAPAYRGDLRVEHIGKASMPKLSEAYFYYVFRNHLVYFLEVARPRWHRTGRYALLFVQWWWSALWPQVRKRNWAAVRGVVLGTLDGLRRVQGPRHR